MKTDSWHREDCRLCGSKDLEIVVPFVPTPIADAFVPKKDLGQVQKTFPLDLYFCRGCGHVQMLDVVNPELLFGTYTYHSGASAGILKHFSEYVDSAVRRAQPPPGALAVDIGSNDGTLLKYFKQKGLKVLGVDAARNIAAEATAAGIETLPEFFNIEIARQIRKKYGPASIVTANNVFAHTDDLAGMLDSVMELLAPDGMFVFEASYVVDVVDKMLLGAIFHEHVSHHAVEPMQTFLARHGAVLVDVERNNIQGGSFIGFVRKAGGSWKPSPAVDKLIAEERERGFHKPDVYKAFSARINTLRDQAREVLEGIKSRKGHIAGFGAARGGTTLVYHFGLGDFLEYIVDDNPEKHNLFSPGLHIPVLPSQVLYEKEPGYLFLLAWVHAKPILEKHKKYLDRGGHFVIAHPKLEVV